MNKSESGLEIVLIEDSQNDIDLFLNVVDWIGMGDHVKVFPDGNEALDHILNGELNDNGSYCGPLVIFLDLKMPLINGIEILKELRHDVRTKNIPIVVFTSSDQDNDILESYQLGANSYVIKPVQFEKFANTIRDLINYWRSMNRPPSYR